MRLDKYIADCTPLSRREVRIAVKRGTVTVDGSPAKSPDMQIPESAVVCMDGTVLEYRKYIYLMLNKPQGYLSAVEDAVDPCVTELVPEQWQHFRVFPAGRLDKDTEGLLLLTNDGQFDHRITSPGKNLYKRYFARLDRTADESDAAAFQAGMIFKDFTAKPAKLEICADAKEVYVEIAEGKFHQVKRMFEQRGKEVVYLKRVAIGALKLDESLACGEVRELTVDELALFGQTGEQS